MHTRRAQEAPVKRATAPFTAIGVAAARQPGPDRMDNLLFESPLEPVYNLIGLARVVIWARG
jgi:hypothetical protein